MRFELFALHRQHSAMCIQRGFVATLERYVDVLLEPRRTRSKRRSELASRTPPHSAGQQHAPSHTCSFHILSHTAGELVFRSRLTSVYISDAAELAPAACPPPPSQCAPCPVAPCAVHAFFRLAPSPCGPSGTCAWRFVMLRVRAESLNGEGCPPLLAAGLPDCCCALLHSCRRADG